MAIPAAFQAENFDWGGEGVAYHDSSKGNQGGQYRLGEDVDIITSADASGGGYVINNFTTGEWLAYTISVATGGKYNVQLRTSSSNTTSAFHIEVDGAPVTGSIVIPHTSGWTTFVWGPSPNINLSAGKHVLKIVADQQYFNLNLVNLLQLSKEAFTVEV